MASDNELIRLARSAARKRRTSEEMTVGEVGAALETEEGNVYTGISVNAACGIGFCAEHAAIAKMLEHGETRIKKMVAVSEDGRILPPCGRCRELVYQADHENLNTRIITSEKEVRTLKELLPLRWQEAFE